MKLSTFSAKWLMNFYPPLLFNRVVIKRISKDYKEVDVVIKKSFLNKNLQGTIFGGTIFSAADPFYAMMYWQHFNLEGIKCEAWLKSAEIEYLKPGSSNLFLYFRLTDQDIEEARIAMNEKGKFEKLHTLNISNIKGEQISRVKTLVYLRIARGESKGVF
jgi:acyl-coenzyme A thioesterase PaaI-like protein